MDDSRRTFWKWFFLRGDTAPGATRLFDFYLFVHLAIGLVVATLAAPGLAAAATVVLFPLAGVVIGLAFAWGANSVAMMQTPEVEELGKHRAGGVEEYLRVFQLAVLVVLSVIVGWGLCGLGVPQAALAPLVGTSAGGAVRFLGRAAMYAASALAVRTAWEVVVGTQELLGSALRIKRENHQECEVIEQGHDDET